MPLPLLRPSRLQFLLLSISFTLWTATTYWLWRGKLALGLKGQWKIEPGENPWPAPAWGLPLAVLLIYGGLAALSAYDRCRRAKTRREQTASRRLCQIGLFLISLCWPWALLGSGGTSNLIFSQWSDISNEYFSTAYQLEDAREFSRTYAAEQQKPKSVLIAHVATHPPGAVLFYYGARRVYESVPLIADLFSGMASTMTGDTITQLAGEANAIRLSSLRAGRAPEDSVSLPNSAVGAAIWCAFLISLALATTTFAVYSLAATVQTDNSETEQHELRGLLAAALWALAPSANLFAFTLDSLIACGAAWSLACLALYHRSGKVFWLLISGAILSLTSFISFGALATGAIGVLTLLLLPVGEREKLRTTVFYIVGFIGGWLLLILLFPSQPFVIFAQAMEAHRFATVSARSRWGWLWLNIVMFALFCGWPLFVSTTRGAWEAIYERWRERDVTTKLDDSVLLSSAIGAAAMATMLMLTLSGAARGEVERLWLFLIPPLCALAAWTLMRKPNLVAIAALLFMQAAQTLLMAAWLAPLVRPL